MVYNTKPAGDESNIFIFPCNISLQSNVYIMKAQSCDRMCEERLSDKSNDQRRNAALNDLSSAGYTADDADCVQTSVTGMKQRHTCRADLITATVTRSEVRV